MDIYSNKLFPLISRLLRPSGELIENMSPKLILITCLSPVKGSVMTRVTQNMPFKRARHQKQAFLKSGTILIRFRLYSNKGAIVSFINISK